MYERILISGASIAGPALAFWLARYGFRPTVVELAPRLREGGNGVDVRAQAVEVAERMGIMPRIRAAAADVIGMSFVNAADRSVARIDMQAIQRKQAGGEVEIMRGDLAAILYDVTKNDVEYVLGDSIRTLEQADDGVMVCFERGPSRRFDLVIGADGVHSTVRHLTFGPESQFIRYMGHYFAFANADPALGEDRWVTAYNEPGKMAGVYRSGNHAGAKANFIFRRREPLSYDHRDMEQQKRLLSEAFAGVPWQVPELLAGALADPDFYFDALSQVRMPSWSSGRVALVGDAAYCASPVSGAGAMLALTGAYRLAGELSAAAGDHRAAFRRYEEGHRKIVERMQQVGPNVRLVVPKNRIGVWARNTITRSPLLESMAGMERIVSPGRIAPLPDFEAGSPVLAVKGPGPASPQASPSRYRCGSRA
ncbi:FAD-dependent monooxygenase [Actinomadura sp. HBU206391]|uniref:FAD-dependent monooxygenase n=1 Tax=Actinomadura sp. HBU206391 TaxID=2731692 RepID=UPI00165029BE|nr:FAD-dependent monooxygenase [Actinomadura sp. HBU206391]MBC6457002.1 FAD-dependent monooxygenase [Actinomadura sp. HBU206391]